MWNERRWIAGIAALAAVVAVSVSAVLGWKHFHADHGAEHGMDHGAHEAHAAHGGLEGLALDEGRKWATDAPLRQGMENVRALLAQAGPASAMDDARAAALAGGVRAQVNFMILNCKLEPRADAVLHVLIGELVGGAGELAEPRTRASGLGTIERALQQYPQYFDHPGWG
jgi:hypothetical protein